jgi:hypothetical protein
MIRKNEKGGATLITTILILAILTVFGIAVLQTTSTNNRIAGNFKLDENAFGVAEAGLVEASNLVSSWSNLTGRLFCKNGDVTVLPDIPFNDFVHIVQETGDYAGYFDGTKGIKGTVNIPVTGGETLTGRYYVRFIDNDRVDTNGDGIHDLANIAEDTQSGTGFVPDFGPNGDLDNNVYIESLGVILRGNTVIASKVIKVRICNRESVTGYEGQVQQGPGNEPGEWQAGGNCPPERFSVESAL